VAKPVVDRIEDQSGTVEVVRVSTGSISGNQLAQRYGVRGIPALLVIDGEGEVVLRQIGRIKREPVLQALDMTN